MKTTDQLLAYISAQMTNVNRLLGILAYEMVKSETGFDFIVDVLNDASKIQNDINELVNKEVNKPNVS